MTVIAYRPLEHMCCVAGCGRHQRSSSGWAKSGLGLSVSDTLSLALNVYMYVYTALAAMSVAVRTDVMLGGPVSRRIIIPAAPEAGRRRKTLIVSPGRTVTPV